MKVNDKKIYLIERAIIKKASICFPKITFDDLGSDRS